MGGWGAEAWYLRVSAKSKFMGYFFESKKMGSMSRSKSERNLCIGTNSLQRHTLSGGQDQVQQYDKNLLRYSDK